MILHMVLCNLPDGADGAELGRVMAGLAGLVDTLDGFEAFDHGPNIGLEGLSPEISHGFICRFRDRAAVQRYLADPDHSALGQRLVDLCDGGVAGLQVVDLDCAVP